MNATEEIRERRARCQPHLLRLRMNTCGVSGIAPAERVAAEVSQATAAILTEVEALVRSGLDYMPGRARVRGGPFLGVRLAWLTAAADDAIRAAREGNAAELRARVRSFDTMVSAIWVIQDAVHSSSKQEGVS